MLGGEEQVWLSWVAAVGRVLENEFSPGLVREVKERARAFDDQVGGPQLLGVPRIGVGTASDVSPGANGRRATATHRRGVEEATNREGTTGRCRDDGHEFAGRDATLEVGEEVIVGNVMCVPPTLAGQVVDHDGLESELVEEGAQAVRAKVRTGEEHKYLLRDVRGGASPLGVSVAVAERRRRGSASGRWSVGRGVESGVVISTGSRYAAR